VFKLNSKTMLYSIVLSIVMTIDGIAVMKAARWVGEGRAGLGGGQEPCRAWEGQSGSNARGEL